MNKYFSTIHCLTYLLTALHSVALLTNIAMAQDQSRFLLDEQTTLTGNFQQGGIVLGYTQAGAEVRFNDELIMLSDKGEFVIGFGRDAELAAKLNITYSDQHRLSHELTISPRQYNIQHIDGLPQAQVSPPNAVLERIRDDNRQVAASRAGRLKRSDFQQQFILPAQGRLSGVYGSQRVLNGQPKRPHFGMDIAADTGTDVIAPASGLITLAHSDMYYSGGTIVLDHGHAVSSTFLHLNEVLVKPGDEIKQGQLIGKIGSTGRATGPHLDWRMNVGKARVDPQLLLTTDQLKQLQKKTQ